MKLIKLGEEVNRMKPKQLFIIKYNTGKYWGGFRSFVKNWYQAQLYSSRKTAERQAKYVMDRRIKWYGNTELQSFEILELELFYKG
jgi:hypothetical protein